MTVHEFDESLAVSHRYADAPWWGEVYTRLFPGHVMQDMRADGWWQRAGIDRILNLANGTQVRIDEKVRPKATGADFLLEAFSKWYGPGEKRNQPGWVAKPLACDYIAYAFVRLRRCYLLPTRELQRAWLEHRSEWWKLAKEDAERSAQGERHGPYSFVDAKNRGYVTRNVAVPVSAVLEAIRDCMVIDWVGQPEQAAS